MWNMVNNPTAPKFQDTFFSCWMDPELQFLHKDGRKEVKTIIQGLLLALQGRHANMSNAILPFGRSTLFGF